MSNATPQTVDTEKALAEATAQLEALQKERQEAEAKAEALQKELAEKDKELAKAKKPGKATASAPAPQAAAGNDPKRRVKIKLFKDNNRYKEDLFVRVNGYTAMIPRGKEVEVPYFVAKHIEEMTQQDASTAAMVEGLVTEYQKKSKEV